MTFSERMRELLEQGVAASKDFAVKAGAKAQDLGERGVLMIEIKQLESQAQKLIIRLGNATCRLFIDEDRSGIDRDSTEISGILSEIIRVKETIENKEAELRARKA